ncbi:MAG: type IV pilin, partial [Methanoregula sp.]|nr:type IV pilin [Methanoregula sp.]
MDYTITPTRRSGLHNRNKEDPESALSHVIGVLLLITIVMVMGGIISLVLTSQPLPDKVPMAYLGISKTEEGVELVNKAGDTLTSKSITILVDGVDRTNEFRTLENTIGWERLDVGEHIYYKSSKRPESITIVYAG